MVGQWKLAPLFECFGKEIQMFLKDPDAILDYSVDWAAAIDGGVSISASSWAVHPDEPGGVSVASASLEGSVALVRLAGGLPGHVYSVGNQVVLGDGSRDERSLTIRVENR
jgi:hypothetical protein